MVARQPAVVQGVVIVHQRIGQDRQPVGNPLPVLPLRLSRELNVLLNLEESYLSTCQSLRFPA
jgi:hypothetical protein